MTAIDGRLDTMFFLISRRMKRVTREEATGGLLVLAMLEWEHWPCFCQFYGCAGAMRTAPCSTRVRSHSRSDGRVCGRAAARRVRYGAVVSSPLRKRRGCARTATAAPRPEHLLEPKRPDAVIDLDYVLHASSGRRCALAEARVARAPGSSHAA